jgi:hypothetical protein
MKGAVLVPALPRPLPVALLVGGAAPVGTLPPMPALPLAGTPLLPPAVPVLPLAVPVPAPAPAPLPWRRIDDVAAAAAATAAEAALADAADRAGSVAARAILMRVRVGSNRGARCGNSAPACEGANGYRSRGCPGARPRTITGGTAVPAAGMGGTGGTRGGGYLIDVVARGSPVPGGPPGTG